jgi:hypothetical protein
MTDVQQVEDAVGEDDRPASRPEALDQGDGVGSRVHARSAR